MRERINKFRHKPNKKTRTYRNRTIKIIALFMAVLLSIWFLQAYFLNNADANAERLQGFYLEDRDSLDVVVVGSSEVYCGYAAPLIYDEYGFTSYPYAAESNTVRNFKTIFNEIRANQDPKLIVIEINGAIYKHIDDEAALRRIIDNMPLDRNKIEMVESLDDPNKLEYYFTFIKYHGAWTNLAESFKWSLSMIESDVRGYSLLKGVKNRTISVHPQNVYKTSEIQKRNPIFFDSYVALKSFLEYLQSEGIPRDRILFVRFPHIITDENKTRYFRGNSIGDTIRRFGYDFVSFDVDDPAIGLDPQHDFYNIEHMNIYGQKKFSRYFGQWLRDRYSITPSTQTRAQRDQWSESVRWYNAYLEYSDHLFSEGKDLFIGEDYYSMRQIKKYLKD